MDSSVRWKDGPQPRRWPSWLRWSTVAVLVSLLVLDLAFPPPLPKIRDTSTLVVARDGTPLRAFADRDGVWRYPASPDTVSPLYLQALLNYEDRWFWKHPGINPWALMRAAGQFVRHGRVVSGGSTLTMQVARMLDRHSRTPWGKVKQMLRAMQLEAHLSKREILTLYLERAPFGGTIEGVDAASWAYLGKPASRLSHAEAALLAVLPQSPSRLRPDRHPDAARVARDKVLQRMVDLGVWSNAQVDDARIEPVVARRLQAPLSAALDWPNACAASNRARRASRRPWTRACSARWKSACRATSPPCPHARPRHCWSSTTPRWRRGRTSARWRSPIANGWGMWTWCRLGVRPARR